MHINNPRINVTFEKNIANLLSHLASKAHKSVASFVRELTLESSNTREDRYLSKLADQLDQKEAKIYSHDEAWK